MYVVVLTAWLSQLFVSCVEILLYQSQKNGRSKNSYQLACLTELVGWRHYPHFQSTDVRTVLFREYLHKDIFTSDKLYLVQLVRYSSQLLFIWPFFFLSRRLRILVRAYRNYNPNFLKDARARTLVRIEYFRLFKTFEKAQLNTVYLTIYIQQLWKHKNLLIRNNSYENTHLCTKQARQYGRTQDALVSKIIISHFILEKRRAPYCCLITKPRSGSLITFF